MELLPQSVCAGTSSRSNSHEENTHAVRRDCNQKKPGKHFLKPFFLLSSVASIFSFFFTVKKSKNYFSRC